MEESRPREVLREQFASALEAVEPYRAVMSSYDALCVQLVQGDYDRIFVLGFGKASCAMAKALEDALPERIDKGIVITKYGHSKGYHPQRVRVVEAGHPIPDERGVAGTRELMELAEESGERTLVVCLVSGGGSALLVAPAEGITLEDKKTVTDQLLRAGADIHELNTVRKHLSKVKGGRLAALVYPARTLSLIISDVIGDRFDVIASGPTSPDPTTFQNAMGVFQKYGLTDHVPTSVLKVIKKGIDGFIPENPKEGEKIFKRVRNSIIANNISALEGAKRKAEERGIRAEIITPRLEGEAREMGRWLAREALARKKRGKGTPLMLISGGETTVTVKGSGKGGRNTEFALSFAMEIEGIGGITLLSAGTDGTDGPTDAAGAIVEGTTIVRARSSGLDPDVYLAGNDSYTFFRRTDDLLITGPTGTNVMDIQLVMLS